MFPDISTEMFQKDKAPSIEIWENLRNFNTVIVENLSPTCDSLLIPA